MGDLVKEQQADVNSLGKCRADELTIAPISAMVLAKCVN